MNREHSDVVDNTNAVEIIPLFLETAAVIKTEQITGRVRVQILTDYREETVTETLARNDVDIARVSVGRFVDSPPVIEERDGVTVVPVFEERLIVEKRLFLVEEIHLCHRTTLEPVSETLTLRSTHPVIERD